MLRFLSASDIANEMSMSRSTFKGTFLVVEGASDSRLYSKFVDSGKVKIIAASCKNNVVNAVSICRDKRKDRAVIGIVDRDLDTVLGRKRSPPIFMTDKRDMESTLLSSPALHDVLSEYGDAGKIEEYERNHGPVSHAVANGSNPLGILMYISYKKGMNLVFKELDHTLFTDPRSLETDISKMVATVYSNSMSQAYSRSAIADLVRDMVPEWRDSWDMARGHDAVAVLRIGLRNAFGSYNCKNISDGELGGALRLAYSREYFRASELYKGTMEWCSENSLDLWDMS